MKKFTSFIIIIFLLTAMSLTVSAGNVYMHPDDVATHVAGIEAVVKPNIPSGYNYRIVVTGSTGTNVAPIVVMYCNSSVLNNNGSMYWGRWNGTGSAYQYGGIVNNAALIASNLYSGLVKVGNIVFTTIIPELSTATFQNQNVYKDILESDYGFSLYPNYIVRTDKSELEYLLNQSNQITNDNYTDESWSDFTTARTAGRSVYDNNLATQSQVDEAASNLSRAISNLERKPPPSSSSSQPPSSSSSQPPSSGWYNPPENYLDIENGLRVEHLLPANIAIWDNLKVARSFGIGVLGILLGLYVLLKWARKFFGMDDIDKN